MARGAMERTSARSGMTALVSGAAVGPAVSVLAMPLLTRLYGPEAVGAAAAVLAWASVVSVLATARLELLVPGAPTADAATALARGSAILAASVALVAAVVALLVYRAAGLAVRDATIFGVLGGTAAFLLAVNALLRALLARAHEFTRSARLHASQGAARILVPLGIGTLAPVASGFLLGEVLARALPLGQAWRAVASTRLAHGAMQTAVRRALPVAAVLVPSGLVDALAIALPVPLIARTHGLAAAGLFALVQRLLGAPASLVAPAVGDVLHAVEAQRLRDDAADAGSERSTGPSLLKAFRTAAVRLALGGGALLLPFSLVGEGVLTWIFGDAWAGTGVLLPPLALWAWASLILVPTSRLLIVAGHARWKLVYDACAIAALGAAIIAPGVTLADMCWRIALGQVAAYAVYAILVDRACAHPRSIAVVAPA